MERTWTNGHLTSGNCMSATATLDTFFISAKKTLLNNFEFMQRRVERKRGKEKGREKWGDSGREEKRIKLP